MAIFLRVICEFLCCIDIFPDDLARVWAEIHAKNISLLKYIIKNWKISKRLNNMQLFSLKINYQKIQIRF